MKLSNQNYDSIDQKVWKMLSLRDDDGSVDVKNCPFHCESEACYFASARFSFEYKENRKTKSCKKKG